MPKITKKAKKEWLEWLEWYGTDKFLDAFLESVEGSQSVCVHCQQPIYVDIMEGGGVPDWSTEDGDFGCSSSPDTNDEGTGGHCPMKRSV